MRLATRTILVVSTVLSLIGVADGIYLTNLHRRIHADPEYKAICDINAIFDCGVVALSEYSQALGLPISVWTILGYGLFLFFQIWGLRLRNFSLWPAGLYLFLSSVTLVATAALAVIGEVVIGALCLGCMVMYVINPLLFVGAVILVRRNPGVIGRDLRLLRRPGPVWVAGVVWIASTGVLMASYPKYWNMPLQSECEGVPAGIESDGSCWIGAAEPQLRIIEFSDYQCPFCRRAHSRIRELVKQYPDRIRLTHKHFPLDTACNPGMQNQLHPNACLMARMAYCASRQGKFWVMNDRLFNAASDTTIDPEQLAREVGVDPQTLIECLNSTEAAEHVRADIDEGIQKWNITGTPTFIIDGKTYVGEIPQSVLDRYLR